MATQLTQVVAAPLPQPVAITDSAFENEFGAKARERLKCDEQKKPWRE